MSIPVMVPGLVNRENTMERSTIFYGKMMGKPWENGDLYGKIHHFEWENSLFRLGHVQSQTVSLHIHTVINYWQNLANIRASVQQTRSFEGGSFSTLPYTSLSSFICVRLPSSRHLQLRRGSFSKINSLGDVNRAAARETG